MKTVELFREQLETLGTIRLRIPPELSRRIVKLAKQARKQGENPKRIISQELSKINWTNCQL